MLNDDDIRLLMQEWQLAQQGVERLDKLDFQVRGWTVSGVAGLAAAAFISGNPWPFAVAIVLVLLAFFVEVNYKTYQGVFIKRVEEAEGILRAGGYWSPTKLGELRCFPATGAAFQEIENEPLVDKIHRLIKQSRLPRIFFPYFILLILCVIAWVFFPYMTFGKPAPLLLEDEIATRVDADGKKSIKSHGNFTETDGDGSAINEAGADSGEAPLPMVNNKMPVPSVQESEEPLTGQ